MKIIPVKNKGRIYGYCFVNKNNIVKSLYNKKHRLCFDSFSNGMRINARMLRRKKFLFDEPATRYRAYNQIDNSKFNYKVD